MLHASPAPPHPQQQEKKAIGLLLLLQLRTGFAGGGGHLLIVRPSVSGDTLGRAPNAFRWDFTALCPWFSRFHISHDNIDVNFNGEHLVHAGADGKQARIQRPKSTKAESCTIKCVTTCIRGGAGSPGEGPFNVRR